MNLPNYQYIRVPSSSSAPPLGWEVNQQGTGSREGNQQRVPNPMEIKFIVSRMTSYLSRMFSCENPGGRIENNEVKHEKTHCVLFASNKYFKSISYMDFPANCTKFINQGHQTCVAQLSD